MAKQKIKKDGVRKVATLAKLKLSDSEIDKFTSEFNDILNYVSQLDEVDTDGVEEEHNLVNYKGDVLQEDEVEGSIVSRDDLLQNATDKRTKLGYIVTSKIVEKD
jgi:aspartyl-tRNA(Asn)/glutamyl-tRNA(Gln) amidotransferase subunit C